MADDPDGKPLLWMRYVMRVTLVHNPGAGDQRHTAKRLLKELAEAGYEAQLAGSGRKGLEKALKDPGDLVAVAGGDGSVKKAAIALAGRRIPLAILPIGTANNIAKSLGIKGSVQEIITGWNYNQRQKLAVGTASAAFGTMRFVESVGVGALTELVVRGHEEVGENTAGLTGHEIDRALQLLHRIVAEREPTLRPLGIDGTDYSGEYLLVEAMNTRLVGPNVPLAPEADYSDDSLDVVTVTEAEREVLAEYLEARLHGEAAPLPLSVRRARRVMLRASPGELHVDDAAWEPDETEEDGTARDQESGEVRVSIGAAGVEVLALGRPG
jgi:diacylglycerol kinase (ATP)